MRQLRLFTDHAMLPEGAVRPGTRWRGRGILQGYRFTVVPQRVWWRTGGGPEGVGVLCSGPGWPYGGGLTALPDDAFGDVVVPA